MTTKVNQQNWAQLDFLINNFYEIVEYKRGRGIYGDRVVLKRPRNAGAIFGEPEKLCSFYYMDANAVKELPRTVQEKIEIITSFVCSPVDMNILCQFVKVGRQGPNEWALSLKQAFQQAKTQDFKVLNDILIENNGDPIPAELRENIFNDGFTTKENGSGLGLMLTKKALEEQGFSLTLESATGVTIFNIFHM